MELHQTDNLRVKLIHSNYQEPENTYDRYEVGSNGVESIKEHRPKNGNELHCFVITYKDGKVIKSFNPIHVEYFKVN